ncbi:uncharacterized protein ACBT57_018086 isoform 3-T3 [Dama dama]
MRLHRVVVGWMRDEIMSFLNLENCLRLLDFLCSFYNLKAEEKTGLKRSKLPEITQAGSLPPAPPGKPHDYILLKSLSF